MENHAAFILAAVTLTSATSIVPRLSPPALTAAIKRSPTLPALIELHALQRHNFNHIHISAFWARAGALGSAKSAQALQPAVEDTLRLCTTAEFGCRQITGTVHGLAKSGFGREPECQPLWNALSESALGQLRDYGPREIATTAWSYARCGLGQGYPRLFATLALEARGRLGEYTPQGLANLAWAMAKAQHAALALFAELEAELQRPHRLADFSARELVSTAWAFAASAQSSSPAIFEAIAAEARQRLEDFTLHELAVLGWSLAAADADVAGDLLFGGGGPGGATFAQRCEAQGLEGADAGTLTQLWQWELWRLELRNRARGTTWAGLSACGRDACRDAFLAEPTSAPSNFDASVRAALEAMGLRTIPKVRTPEGFVLDLVVEAPGRRRRVGIEVDGPQQYFGARSREATGAARLKRRQVRAFSELPIMTIPYWEWEALGNGDFSAEQQRKERYLTFAFAVRVGSRAPAGRLLSPMQAPPQPQPQPQSQPQPQPQQQQHSPTQQLPTQPPPPQPVAEATADVLPRFLMRPSSQAAPYNATPGASASPALAFSLHPSRFGRALAQPDALDEAASATLVLVGEVYATPPVVAFEAALLSRMLGIVSTLGAVVSAPRAPCVHVVLEHFNFRHQPMLDEYMQGVLPLSALLERYAADGTESHELVRYTPLLELARSHAGRARLVAGFLPRPLAQAFIAEGEGAAEALAHAKSEGYLGEDLHNWGMDATEAHYAFFESLVTGRPLHGAAQAQQPSNLARRLFPAQIMKSAAMAHRVARLAREHPADRYLVICGSSHMLFNHGVPERLFAAVPRLRGDCCRIVARQASDEQLLRPGPGQGDEPSAEPTAAAELAAAFGTDTDAADLAFLYGDWKREA